MRTERRWFTCTNPTGSSPTPACFLWRFRASQAVANCRERLADGGESRRNAAARSTSVHISVNAGTSRETPCGGGILVEQPPERTWRRAFSSLPGGATRHVSHNLLMPDATLAPVLALSCPTRSNSYVFFEAQAKSDSQAISNQIKLKSSAGRPNVAQTAWLLAMMARPAPTPIVR